MSTLRRMDVADAETKARRFLARVKKWNEKFSYENSVPCGCKESGAMRRSSMELTRSLARLRSSGRAK